MRSLCERAGERDAERDAERLFPSLPLTDRLRLEGVVWDSMLGGGESSSSSFAASGTAADAGSIPDLGRPGDRTGGEWTAAPRWLLE